MSKIDPFNTKTYDLGTNDTGYSQQDATHNLLRSQYPSSTACYVCNNPAHFRIMAKHSKYETATIQDGLYACNHCITLNIVNPKHYGVRPL